ncbi:6476_t:CDS:2, partial [Cetraspora pellucida]
YSRKYIPNNLSPSQEEFFKQADDYFDYSSNFNQTFSVCFCSACYSKYEHIKKVKLNTTDIEKLNTANTKQSESSLYNNSTNCDSELKFKLFVENKNENILFEKKHSRTGAMILQDNDDWKEFLKLYKSIITDKIICDLNSKKSNEPKSKALCISNDDNADKDEIDKADQITKLRQKWKYKIFYSANSYGLSDSPNIDNSFTSAIHSSKTVHKFFLELEVINNESESYTQFKKAFENEKISLDTIKELSESDLIELEVNKMRWCKKIMKLAREY